MDFRRFHLRRRPFPATPDTSLYFPSRSAEAALSVLQYALDQNEGLALVEGEPGIGKTILSLRFLERQSTQQASVWIPSAKFSRPLELYQSIAFDFSMAFQGLGESEVRLTVVDRLLAEFRSGQPTILILDEAQHLSAEILEELRLLGNLESRSRKAVFIVLIALPSLQQRLNISELQPFRQRLAIRARLEPLDPEEARQYLAHQIQQAGGELNKLMTEEAVALLIEANQGIPRLINQSAALAMTLTAQAGQSQVDAEAVLEAVAQLGRSIASAADTIPLVKQDLPSEKPNRSAAKHKGQKRRPA